MMRTKVHTNSYQLKQEFRSMEAMITRTEPNKIKMATKLQTSITSYQIFQVHFIALRPS
jgi:hypothetical protein